jgi:hypothetical protein
MASTTAAGASPRWKREVRCPNLRSLCRVPMGAVRQWLTRVDRDPGIGRAVGGFRHLARLWYLSVRYAMGIAVGLDTVSRSLYAPGMG